MFFYRYTKDADNRLGNLFWTDGRSRADYASFGDAVAFDSTYKTNAYRKPLVIFVGVNHHHQTIIFGCALLIDETVETYRWVLMNFLEAMSFKMPIFVLTDGDKAMRNAIQTCFPNTTHRLCSWHVHRNSTKNIHKDGFSGDFQRCMASWYTEEEFEATWKKLVVDHELHNNGWIADTYANRKLWAEAYLRGKFFAGMRSTQRCEGMNAYFNRFLKSRVKLFEFVRHFERALQRLRQREVNAEFETNNGSPVLKTALLSLEKHGAEIYTSSSFKRFRKELMHETLYNVVEKGKNDAGIIYKLRKFGDDNWKNEVTYCVANKKLECSCKRLESNGIPCRHILAVLKAKNVNRIPDCCINIRWCKNAKCGFEQSTEEILPGHDMKKMRYSALSALCSNLSYLASASKDVFELVKSEIGGLTCRLAEVTQPCLMGSGGSRTQMEFDVNDPVQVTTKGNPGSNGIKQALKKPRHCGHCDGIGHNKRHCPRLGKSPKKQRGKRNCHVKENSEQYETEETEEEAENLIDVEDQENQWEYSTMSSPPHTSMGAHSNEVDHD